MTRSLHVRSRLALVFLLLTVPVARAQRAGAKGEERLRHYAILDLGPVLEGDADGAPSINQRGQVALSTASGAVLWEEGRRRLLTGLAGACDLDERGQVVGWSAGASRRAGLWRSGKVEPVGPVNGVAESVALAISPSGRIVGNYRVEGSTQERSFLHDKGSAMDLVDLGGAAVLARDLNAPETIVGSTRTASGEEHAFSWDRGRMSALTGLGSESTAEALNNPGVIVGRSRTASGGWRGYQMKGGKLSFLAPLPGGGTDVVPLDINERGQIVGSSKGAGMERAVLIEKGHTIDLSELLPEGTTGWELRSATGINASGSIVGLGVHAGQAVAFLLRPMAERPNVLILLGDDFNWDDLHSVATPNLDALAARGMTFTNNYVFPQCSTTRYSLVFGRYPRRDGIGAIVSELPPSPTNPTPTLGLPSIASVWSPPLTSPYQTALIGKWHLGTNPFYDGDPGPDVGLADYGALSPLLHGFDHFLAGSMANLPHDYFHWERVDDGVYSISAEYAPQAQLTAFRAFWDGGRSPRIAYVAPNLAHAPHQRPPVDWLPPGYPPSMPGRKTFEAMLVAFDEFAGRVLAEVDLGNTYVFFLPDNGTQPSISITPCGGLRPPGGCVKTTTFQGGINVPLIVAGPRIPAGTTSSAIVSSTDIMATVAQILDLSSPGEDSVSYWPTLLDPAVHVRRYAFSETFGPSREEGDPTRGPDSPEDEEPSLHEDRAAIGERYKLRFLNGREDLYDLLLDPREGFPLDKSDPALQVVLAELRAVLANPLDRQLQL